MKTRPTKPKSCGEPQAKPSLATCVFFHGFSHFRWVRAVFLWVVILYFGVQSSPLFMYYVVGVPKLEKVKTYEGVVRVEGYDHYSRSGKLMPPRYFLDTATGPVEFHCGIAMSPSDCTHLGFSRAFKDMRVSLAYDTYFGVLAVTYSGKYKELLLDRGHYEDIKRGLKDEIMYDHKNSLYTLVLVLGVYGYWIYRCHRDKR